MTSRHRRMRGAALGGLAVSVLIAVYQLLVRPWHLRWGASAKEVARPMLGDDEVPAPQLDATRAISISTSPAAVWPWLMQMGYKRAGFYSYRFDNAWVRSPDYLIPEYQTLRVGDIVPTGPQGGFTVKAIEPPRTLLLVVQGAPLQVSCSILLDTVAERETRMIGRVRVHFGSGLALFLYHLLFEPGDFIMMRKMFLGIKERAERMSALPVTTAGSSNPAAIQELLAPQLGLRCKTTSPGSQHHDRVVDTVTDWTHRLSVHPCPRVRLHSVGGLIGSKAQTAAFSVTAALIAARHRQTIGAKRRSPRVEVLQLNRCQDRSGRSVSLRRPSMSSYNNKKGGSNVTSPLDTSPAKGRARR